MKTIALTLTLKIGALTADWCFCQQIDKQQKSNSTDCALKVIGGNLALEEWLWSCL